MTGQYRLAGLPTGDYALRIEKEGFQTQARQVMINVSLTLSGQPEQVSVAASITAIDNTMSTSGGLLAERSLPETSSQRPRSTSPTLDRYPFSGKITDQMGGVSNSTTLQRELPLCASVRLESLLCAEKLLRDPGCLATITIVNQCIGLKLFLFASE